MNIIQKDNYYKLEVQDDASIEEYEDLLNYLINTLDAKMVKAINDYDTYYHVVTYNGHNLLLTYSNYFGISVTLDDRKNIEANLQKEVLSEVEKRLIEDR